MSRYDNRESRFTDNPPSPFLTFLLEKANKMVKQKGVGVVDKAAPTR